MWSWHVNVQFQQHFCSPFHLYFSKSVFVVTTPILFCWFFTTTFPFTVQVSESFPSFRRILAWYASCARMAVKSSLTKTRFALVVVFRLPRCRRMASRRRSLCNLTSTARGRPGSVGVRRLGGSAQFHVQAMLVDGHGPGYLTGMLSYS